MKYVRRNFLCGLLGREPGGLEDLNAQLRQWVWSVANQRVHGTTHEQPVARWANIAQHLQRRRRPAALSVRWTKNCGAWRGTLMCRWQGSRYSVPWQYAGKEVWVCEHRRDRDSVRGANGLRCMIALDRHQVGHAGRSIIAGIPLAALRRRQDSGSPCGRAHRWWRRGRWPLMKASPIGGAAMTAIERHPDRTGRAGIESGRSSAGGIAGAGGEKGAELCRFPR